MKEDNNLQRKSVCVDTLCLFIIININCEILLNLWVFVCVCAAQKTGQFCFVSYNLPINVPHLDEYAERKLFELIKQRFVERK
jgi:hypothetical protein